MLKEIKVQKKKMRERERQRETSPPVIIESSPPPLCVPIGPFLPGAMRGSDGPEPAAQGPPEPSAPRTDTHPWPGTHIHNQLV